MIAECEDCQTIFEQRELHIKVCDTCAMEREIREEDQ